MSGRIRTAAPEQHIASECDHSQGSGKSGTEVTQKKEPPSPPLTELTTAARRDVDTCKTNQPAVLGNSACVLGYKGPRLPFWPFFPFAFSGSA